MPVSAGAARRPLIAVGRLGAARIPITERSRSGCHSPPSPAPTPRAGSRDRRATSSHPDAPRRWHGPASRRQSSGRRDRPWRHRAWHCDAERYREVKVTPVAGASSRGSTSSWAPRCSEVSRSLRSSAPSWPTPRRAISRWRRCWRPTTRSSSAPRRWWRSAPRADRSSRKSRPSTPATRPRSRPPASGCSCSG